MEKGSCTLPSPLGQIVICANEMGISHILFEEEVNEENPESKSAAIQKHLVAGKEQLEAYFKKDLVDFNLSLSPEGTEFQSKVWEALKTIPFGKSWSYQELAIKVQGETAVRAVGTANGRNPLPIVVPCHRVIGKNGQLVGFSSGLWRKEWLLRHEDHPAFRAEQLSLF